MMKTKMKRTMTDMSNDAGVRILFATDGSPGAAVAFDTLAALPLRPSDEIVIVSYPSFLLAARPGGGGMVSALMESEVRKAMEIVRTTVASLAKAVPAVVRGFVPTGLEAVDAIVQAALDSQADLIVVGSRGRRLLSSLLLGSTTRTLAMLAPVPVLIVRQRRSAMRRVLVAYDGSPAARAALALVRRLPMPTDASVTLANVLPVRDWSDRPPEGSELQVLRDQLSREDAAHAASLLDEATRDLADSRSNEVLIKAGPVPEAIIDRATEMDADLIVLGSRGVTGPRRPFWGSTAERVATTARCPVLIVPAPVVADGTVERPSATAVVAEPAA
jgi:nucleotide-binding universal stress UspA family protein